MCVVCLYASGNILILFTAISSEINYQFIEHFRAIKFSQILDMHFLKKRYYFYI